MTDYRAKIEKLLRLANDPAASEQERDTALRKARELREKHETAERVDVFAGIAARAAEKFEQKMSPHRPAPGMVRERGPINWADLGDSIDYGQRMNAGSKFGPKKGVGSE